MKGVNPQGCEVHSIQGSQAPEELDARLHVARGQASARSADSIGIFNRSYYEEVLVVRVHPDMLDEAEPASQSLVDQGHLEGALQGYPRLRAAISRATVMVVLKFFLHVSKEEQKRAVPGAASKSPPKRWKFSMGDVARAQALGQVHGRLRGHDPPRPAGRRRRGIVVPADHKWFTRLVVAAEVVEALDRLGLKYPKVSGTARRDLEKARQILRQER